MLRALKGGALFQIAEEGLLGLILSVLDVAQDGKRCPVDPVFLPAEQLLEGLL